MELSITTLAIGAGLIFMAGALVGCAYYSWERHYRFKRRGSAEHEVGVRFSVDTPPTFFGLPAVNDLLR